MEKNLNEKFIKELSNKKGEPKWMLDFRLKAYHVFKEKENPDFGPELDINFDELLFYKNEGNKLTDKWDEVNQDIKNTFLSLGVIEAEEKYLDGVTNQFESEVIYHNQTTQENIIFTSTDEALKKYPELFLKYFNNLVI